MFDSIEIKSIQPIRDHVLVTDMSFDAKQTRSGIIIPDLDMKLEGIHPRWARVFAVGPEQKDIKVGQYICVAHGRWTRGIKVKIDGKELVIRRVDNNDILLVSDEPQFDENIGEGL